MAERRKQLFTPTTLLLACLAVVAGTPEEATIAEQRSLIQNLTAKVAAQDQQITLLNNKMSSLENSQDFSQMTQFNTTLNSVQSEITILKTKDSSLEQEITSIQDDITNLKSKDNSQDQQTSLFNTTLNSVQSDIMSLKTKDSSIDQEITSVQDDITSLKTKDAAQNQKMTSLQDDVTSLKSQDAAQNRKMTSLQYDVTSLTSQHAYLRQQLTQLKVMTSHVESGWFRCSPRENFERYETKSFHTPYLSQPVVHVGVRLLNSVNDNGRYDHRVYVTSVNSTHFTVKCQQFGSANLYMTVSWISVPVPR